MNDLANKKCVPCEGNIPPFDKSEIHKYLKKVDGWDVKSDENKSFFLFKEFKFKKFDKLNFPAKPRWPLDENALFMKGAGVKL